MKKIIFFAFCSLALVTAFSQQNDKLQSALIKGVAMLDSARDAAKYTAVANYFERIATTETNEWLPQYYTAYSLLLAGISSKEGEEAKDAIYEKATRYATRADKLKPGNSEVTVMQAYIVFMQMAVSPQARAMSMIPQSMALVERAIALNPDNPRAYLIKGQNLFYTPEMFGGSKEEAKQVLAAALKKFETNNGTAPEPVWGKRRTNELLDQLK